MRTAKFSIDGQTYLLCFSGRVLRNVTEHFGGLTEMYQAFGQEDQTASFDAAVWTMAQMLQAGDRYAKRNGMDNPGPLTADDLYDLCDIREFSGLYAAIRETITSGQRQHVAARPDPEAETRGNGGAAPG